MMAKSVETRKTIVKIGFALLLGIMFFVAYLSKTEPMAEPSSSYFNVLDLLLQQLRGEQPYQVIEGNMHGAVYPISLA